MKEIEYTFVLEHVEAANKYSFSNAVNSASKINVRVILYKDPI
jgi:hypothetical protein